MARENETRELTKAYFQAAGGEKVDVHFNPQTLQYDITNKLENKGKGANTKQFVSSSTAKLSLDAVFDTTATGEDVRLTTAKIGAFMNPGENETPPEVTFQWGLYKFVGMLESFKETIEFFSHDGVPLRATVKLAMANQDTVFTDSGTGGKSSTGGSLKPDSAVPTNAPPGKGVTEAATKGGNPGAGRALARANGLESMRFAAGGQVEVGAEVNLRGPETFASASGGAGVSLGASLELGVGASVGGKLSAGVSAGAGAFAGLRAGASAKAGAGLDLSSFETASVTGSLGLEVAGGIGLGGTAELEGSASMKTDVGSAGALTARIEFEGG